MGTCFSHPARENTNHPYSESNGNNHDASSRPINSSQPQFQRPLTARSIPNNGHQPTAQAQALTNRTNRPDQPLRLPPAWTSEDRTWTRDELDKERRAFFDTRVTNERVIWDNIKSACEVLWAGGDAGDSDGGLGTAQGILTASDVTLPAGDLVRGCYDRAGNLYRLPPYIVSDPTNIASTPAPPSPPAVPGCAMLMEGSVTPLTEEQAEIRREKKGKAVEDPMVITIKRSDLPDTRANVDINRTDTCRLIAIKIEEQTAMDPAKMVALYYRGKKMDENKTLADNEFSERDVISAMVLERDRSQWGAE